nr:MAG TPA: tail component [Caudoviricetes sp.]
MNELIETLFKDFTVDGVSVPVSFLFYEGHGEPYITYMQTDADSSYSGDDELLGYADYYDFDIYSKGDYTNIVKSVKALLKANDFVWQPSRTSPDMYETDTGYYHKTLCFAILREEK